MATTIKIPVKLVAGHISAAAEIAAGKSLLPMLSNMLLEFDGSKIRLTATNLTVTFVASVPFESPEYIGKLLLPAKTLSAAIAGVSSENFFLTVDGNTATVTDEPGDFSVKLAGGGNIEDFPAVTVTEAGELALNGTAFAEKLAFVKHEMGKVGATAGVKVDFNGQLTLVATDGIRMAISEEPYAGEKQMSFTVPAEAVAAIQKTASGEKSISLAFNNEAEAIDIIGEAATVSTRCISGAYPNYGGILQTNPVVPDNTIVLDRKLLVAAIDRLNAVSTGAGTVTISPSTEGLVLSVQDDTTAGNIKVAVKKMTETIPEKSSYSLPYISAALAVGKSEEIGLTLPSGAGKPLIISGGNVREFIMHRTTT
ncbi:MAG TPA: DNA polymerase III subunit beta [Smithellaceae bacterium]|nr:DNA polymerase III subunit beta [Smithellaceae bacterium]